MTCKQNDIDPLGTAYVQGVKHGIECASRRVTHDDSLDDTTMENFMEIHIHGPITIVSESEKLFQILTQLEKIMAFIEDVNAAVSSLSANVAGLTSTVDSVVTVIADLNAKVQALAAVAVADPAQALAVVTNIASLSQAVADQSTELHDAIVANTTPV